jgi:hypothetical protein
MGLMSRTSFEAEVRLSGLSDDPESTDTVAQVQFKANGRPERPRDLALFLPMSVVAVLRGCRSAPTHSQSFLDICGELADALLDWDPAAQRPFSLREAIDEPFLDAEGLALIYDGGGASEEMVDSWLRHCLPRVSDQAAGGHRRRFKAELREPRRSEGVSFVALSSRNRNSFLEIQGVLAMFESAAVTRDYAATVRPAAATLRRLLDFNAEAFGAQSPEFAEATWLYQLAEAISQAQDPLSAPLPTFAGTDVPGEQALMEVKLGRWARASGLDAEQAAQELSRRLQAGEPVPWDNHAA